MTDIDDNKYPMQTDVAPRPVHIPSTVKCCTHRLTIEPIFSFQRKRRPRSRRDIRSSAMHWSRHRSIRRCALEFLASATVDATPVALNAIVVIRDDGRFHLDVCDARPVRDVDSEGLALMALDKLGLAPLTLTADDIKREPRFANARLVWSYRHHSVGIAMRMRIMSILSEDGPMALSRLLSSVRSDRDPSPAVMALACSNLIELDLVSRPLGPATIARCRS